MRGSNKYKFGILCWVKRQYLLAHMTYPRSIDRQRVALFQKLQATAQSLEAILRKNHIIHDDLHASLPPLICLKESNSMTELASIIVCEAALSSLNDDAILDHTRPLPSLLDTDGSLLYWLVNIACWAGSLALLDFLESETLPNSSEESRVNSAALQCIPTAIWRGHRDMVQHILRLGPLTLLEEYRHHLCPIQAAITLGNVDTIYWILEQVKPASISKRLLVALMARPKPDQKKSISGHPTAHPAGASYSH